MHFDAVYDAIVTIAKGYNANERVGDRALISHVTHKVTLEYNSLYGGTWDGRIRVIECKKR